MKTDQNGRFGGTLILGNFHMIEYEPSLSGAHDVKLNSGMGGAFLRPGLSAPIFPSEAE